MKRIPIAKDNFLHIYLIKEKAISGDMFEGVRESMSRREEAEQNGGKRLCDFEQGALDFVEALQDRYCMAFVESLADELVKLVVEHWAKYSPSKLEGECERFADYNESRIKAIKD